MKLTKQEVFDKVVAHLRKQGCKSIDADGCLYRGPDGTMCAAGCLIDDEDYHPFMEGYPIILNLETCETGGRAAEAVFQNTEHLDLVLDLQDIHDYRMVEQWEKGFAEVAWKHGTAKQSRHMKLRMMRNETK